MTINQFLYNYYDYKVSFIGPIVGIMFGFIIFFAGLAIVCLKFVNFVSLLACCLVAQLCDAACSGCTTSSQSPRLHHMLLRCALALLSTLTGIILSESLVLQQKR